jgi:hypothetical protein
MTFMTFFYDIWDSILFRKVLEFLLLHKKHKTITTRHDNFFISVCCLIKTLFIDLKQRVELLNGR